MKLVIAEKPSVARSIASVIGATTNKDGYVEGNGYKVSWCVGHLVGLCNAEEYDERYATWNYDDLPIVPESWKSHVLANTKKQFQILKKLMHDKEIDTVVCATDAGREGELIFRLVYEQAGCKKPVKRLWISSMEESAIRKGMNELKDGAEYDALYESALSRAKADWLVGINATRLFSVLYRKTLNVGRVMSPTLAMIVDRNQKVSEFKKEKYYTTHLKFGTFDAVSKHFATREEADQVARDCNERMCQVEKEDRKKKVVKAPKLYDLTTLQRECNRIFGYTAKQTLDYTQNLYEKKLVTYPRTDSQFLTEDMEASTELLVSKLLRELPYGNKINYKPEIKKVCNSKKVSDHHAIIPTMEVTGKVLWDLPAGERCVLLMIAAKLLMATADSYVYETVKCELICNHHTFTASSKKLIQEGFHKIETIFKEYIGKKNEEEESDMELWLAKSIGPMTAVVAEQFTQPPKQYTEDTLLSSMERAGNEDADEEAEKKGLGTPATRAGIIEKLIQSGFVQREKKNLIPTNDGISLVTILPEEIRSAKMTAEWESCLTNIAKGKQSADDFLKGITDMMSELIGRYEGVSQEQKATFANEKESIGNCPRCGSPVHEGAINFYCSSRDCSFALWKNNAYFASIGKQMDKATAEKLLSVGKIKYKDLVSKRTGKKFSATVIMDDPGTGYVKFKMEFPKKDQSSSTGSK